MKQTIRVSALATLLSINADAQSRVVIDPIDPLTDFTSLAEWNTEGDAEGWTTNQLTPNIAGGSLSGTTNGGDTQLINNPFAAPIAKGTPGIVTVEFRLTRAATDTSRIDLFWNDASGGFAAARRLTLPGTEIPADGSPHVYQFILENVNTELRGLRLDGSVQNGTFLEFDYVRLGIENLGPSVDPTQTINLFTSLGEFNTDGDLEGWNGVNIAPTSVAGGNLIGLTNGRDPQFTNTTLNIDPTTTDADIVEIRLRREIGDTSRIDLFWGDDNGGFAAVRRTSLPDGALPDDGQFHIIQSPIGSFINGTLTSLRIDPSADQANSIGVDIDYIRIGSIVADDDNDGLANDVETNTGVFVDAGNTGTDPNNDDSDNDTYLDGDEVTAGTDPNNPDDFPAPMITGYSEEIANYLINEPITDNAAMVAFGTPVGFSVTPLLPSGLSLNPANGTISGTPEIASEETVYSITADFGGGVTDDFELTLATVYPGIVRYGTNNSIYRIGAEINLNEPILTGGDPTAFAITPPLPTGLLFNTTTGAISGTPSEVTPATTYTVTATYADTPDAGFTLNIRTRAIPVYLGRDNDPLTNFTSLGEWETDGMFDGWTFARLNANVAAGIFTANTTGGDPIMNRPGLIDTTPGLTIEIRLRQNDNEFVQFFWADDTGGPAPSRQTSIPGDQILNDGDFHTYQVTFEDVFVGDFDLLRVDPGNTANRTVEIDYIRIGTPAPPTAPEISAFNFDTTFGDIEITWNSTQGATYRVESALDLNQLTWNEVTTVKGDADSTTFLGAILNSDRFFRVVREN